MIQIPFHQLLFKPVSSFLGFWAASLLDPELVRLEFHGVGRTMGSGETEWWGQAICYPNRRDVPSYSPVLCFQRREEARDRVARQSQPLLLAGAGW